MSSLPKVVFTYKFSIIEAMQYAFAKHQYKLAPMIACDHHVHHMVTFLITSVAP